MDNELLYNELYEKTKDCGRTQFVKLLMEKERENKQLKKQIDNILNYCNFEIKKERDKFPCPLESEQWLKGRISAFEEILQVEKSDN